MADDKGDKIDVTLNVVLAATLGVIFICSFALPTIVGPAGLGAIAGEAYASYRPLISVVGMVLIIGLIIPIVRGYNSRSR